jgi:hypothetical protein
MNDLETFPRTMTVDLSRRMQRQLAYLCHDMNLEPQEALECVVREGLHRMSREAGFQP